MNGRTCCRVSSQAATTGSLSYPGNSSRRRARTLLRSQGTDITPSPSWSRSKTAIHGASAAGSWNASHWMNGVTGRSPDRATRVGSVVEAGRAVRVNSIANVSAGATAADVLGVIHPDNARAAVRAAKAIGLNICGVDFVSPDISKSWHEVGGGICEVNASVGLRPHLQAAPQIDVCDMLLQAMFSQGDGRIPIAMVTGAIGKTSTSTMLASILGCAGYIVGSATTEGVRIDGELVEQADLANADGASIVLRDATVTAAVLETARGGIVKTGLYVDRCDVAALLNVDRDQIGMDGVETLDDMVETKRKVLDVARKAVVLNADDPRCLALAEEFKPRLRTILFSKSPETAAIRGHVAAGGEVLFLAKRDGRETIVVASAVG